MSIHEWLYIYIIILYYIYISTEFTGTALPNGNVPPGRLGKCACSHPLPDIKTPKETLGHFGAHEWGI